MFKLCYWSIGGLYCKRGEVINYKSTLDIKTDIACGTVGGIVGWNDGCKTIKVTLNPGDNSVSVGRVDINGYEAGMELYGKILVWDSTYGTKPLVTAEKFEIQ